jgi:hypothetical protein
MDEVAFAVGTVAHQYMREIGQTGGPGSVFRAVLFGHCPRTGHALAFQYEPTAQEGQLTLQINKQNLGPSDVVIIGNNPDELRARIDQIRSDPSIHPIIYSDAPERALKSLINDGSISTVGGAVQQAWATGHKIVLIATADSIVPVPQSPRNVGMFVLGFDTVEMQHIGAFQVSLIAR